MSHIYQHDCRYRNTETYSTCQQQGEAHHQPVLSRSRAPRASQAKGRECPPRKGKAGWPGLLTPVTGPSHENHAHSAFLDSWVLSTRPCNRISACTCGLRVNQFRQPWRNAADRAAWTPDVYFLPALETRAQNQSADRAGFSRDLSVARSWPSL